MVITAIKTRRSIRSYQTKPIPKTLITQIIKAGQFAPTAKNNQAVEFVIVNDQLIKNQLYELLGQDFLKQAPILIIPFTDTQMTSYPIQDLSVASENIFLQAAEFGLGTVWKNVPPALVPAVKKIIKLPDNFTLINIIPVGYPKKNEPPHSDHHFNPKKIHHNLW